MRYGCLIEQGQLMHFNIDYPKIFIIIHIHLHNHLLLGFQLRYHECLSILGETGVRTSSSDLVQVLQRILWLVVHT
jgi:hypothetical protein